MLHFGELTKNFTNALTTDTSLNLDLLVNSYGAYYYVNSWRTLNDSMTQVQIINTGADVVGKISIQVGLYSENISEGYVVLEYTKTTD